MSDQEYESFEVTDYDLDNEFNTNRPRRRFSKNQQIYGIWAEDSDEDGDDRPSFGAVGRKSKNYSAPIGFVSGGVQQAGKDKETKQKSDEGENEEPYDITDSDEEQPKVSFKKKTFDPMAGIPEEIAGMRKKKSFQHNPVLAQRGVGTWEKHTKGIGAKLLLQMGFQPGKGLGKDLQGIHAPIEAQLRKGRGAIGAYGPEKSAKIAELPKIEQKKDSKDSGERSSQWRKGEVGKKKPKYVYKSIEDVLHDQSSQPMRKREFNELSKVKVIDMTGPEQRILSGYHAISGNQRPTDEWESKKDKTYENFSMPELMHNLDLLVDMCEQDIIAKDKQLRYNEDRMISLEHEAQKLKKVTENESALIEGLESLLETLEALQRGANDGSITLDEMAVAFKRLKDKHPTEYMMYDLSSLAPSFIRPILRSTLSSWDPMKAPKEPFAEFAQWRLVLSETQSSHTLSAATLQNPFDRLLWDAWMPCIRIAVNAWNVKDPDPMMTLLDAWKPLLPSWILDNILQQLVMPRLQNTAEDWNPLTDTVPVHTWTHPWVPLLSKRLKVNVFPVIRQKLATALTSWHPSDTSARLLLMPWASVFTQSEMDTFLINNIMPKLGLVLQEFAINPNQQVMEPWNWVMDWCNLASPALIADLLAKSFFPRWLQVLTMWLNMAPNYDQVAKWYSGWKSLIPDKVRDQPAIKESLRTALELMSRSVGGPVAPPPPPPPPAPAISDHQRFQGMAESVGSARQMVDGFKDLVQKRCEENGIVFHPIANRYREAKQVYRCGSAQIYIDRSVIFYCDPKTNQWTPISLPSLLQGAKNSY
ncbi:Septin-interacting protein 1 [Nesidiocoris tenuis]|uniref:Septin-interacting protein 1 n=1 Tax=Nesidiocoris tenuis TaxID=355587 RepID=A0ABN7AZ16_9HEMI|nr:Septin-interacting protein 1 [Nesidiocoris tenuis]